MKRIFISIVATATLFVACDNNKSTSKTEKQTTETSKNPEETKNQKAETAVCLYEKLSVRKTPQDKGKWLASMSLGEQVELLGEEVADSTSKKERKYSKIRLIDGKEGWALSSLLAPNGKVSVFINDANIYSRPDLLNKTSKKYSAMDIVAIVETKNDWIKVRGKRAEGTYIEEGWTKPSNISESQVDIATAKYAAIAITKGSMSDRIKVLQEIIDNPDFSSSKFISTIKDKISDYQSKNSTVEQLNDDIEINE